MNTQEIKEFFAKMQAFASRIAPKGAYGFQFNIDGDEVNILWEESWNFGGYGFFGDSIPLEWTTLTPDEMIAKHNKRKTDRENAEAQRKEKERVEKEQQDEKRDLANYKRLKAKYSAE